MIEYKTLYEISMLLNSECDIHKLMAMAVDKIIETTQAQRGLLLVRHPNGGLLFECARDSKQNDIKKPDSEISITVINSVLDSGESLVISNAVQNSDFDASKSIKSLHIMSIACAPLKSNKETFGVIYIDNRNIAALFGEPTKLLLVELSKLVSIQVKNSLDRQLLLDEQRKLKDELEEQKGYDTIIGSSPGMLKLLDFANQVSRTNTIVLITGETGTGKELIARHVHHKSDRNEHELVILDCSTIAENLIESELFGCEKGAFTGADKTKPGWFEIADKGTIFLDEIGEMSLTAQKKLLRFIQTGDFTPVGSKKTRNADVRIIVATHRDLAEMVKAGTFRQDLYYRIHVVELHLPPLRERRDDIIDLALYYLNRIASKSGKRITDISEGARRLLMSYSYPGNVRELCNIIERAVIFCDEPVIQERHLAHIQAGHLTGLNTSGTETNFNKVKKRFVEQFEKDFLRTLLKESRGNITRAAATAGMYKKNFIDKMKLYTIEAKEFKE
jgi:Nif-specific regulatory protein